MVLSDIDIAQFGIQIAVDIHLDAGGIEGIDNTHLVVAKTGIRVAICGSCEVDVVVS